MNLRARPHPAYGHPLPRPERGRGQGEGAVHGGMEPSVTFVRRTRMGVTFGFVGVSTVFGACPSDFGEQPAANATSNAEITSPQPPENHCRYGPRPRLLLFRRVAAGVKESFIAFSPRSNTGPQLRWRSCDSASCGGRSLRKLIESFFRVLRLLALGRGEGETCRSADKANIEFDAQTCDPFRR